jgi:hypothetical protein
MAFSKNQFDTYRLILFLVDAVIMFVDSFRPENIPSGYSSSIPCATRPILRRKYPLRPSILILPASEGALRLTETIYAGDADEPFSK